LYIQKKDITISIAFSVSAEESLHKSQFVWIWVGVILSLSRKISCQMTCKRAQGWSRHHLVWSISQAKC